MSAITQTQNKGNFIKLHRKVKQNEKVCHAQTLGSNDQGQRHSQRFVTYKSCLHNNSKTAEVNLIKFHTMVKHNEKEFSSTKFSFP